MNDCLAWAFIVWWMGRRRERKWKGFLPLDGAMDLVLVLKDELMGL
jgi:hypothetical protein